VLVVANTMVARSIGEPKMTPTIMTALKRILRSPKVIVSELAALAVTCSVGAVQPAWHVFGSLGFATLTLLTAISLSIVIRDQILTLLRVGATTRRVGVTMLHAGLMLVILAGAVRALFAAEAVVDLIEGETLPPTASAWFMQFPGLLARPFQLTQPVTLQTVNESRYPDGSLRELTARLSAGELAINHDLTLPGGRLFLTSDFSPAALIEWSPGKREAALLNSHTREGTATGPNGLRAYMRAFTDRPAAIEVRVMRGNGLLYAGDLHVGQTLTLAGGETLTLHGMPLWARLRGSRDASPWLAYLGFAFILTGSVLLFAPLAGVDPRVVCKPLALMLMLSSCGRPPHDQARQLVERYNTVVAEAYRRGDVRLIDPVVGPNEGKKLTGLIGVRLDMGLTLDSQLLALEVTGVEQVKNELCVWTKERWLYRDRKIGTGEQVGEESTDSYEMIYTFTNIGKAWMVDEIKFASPPQVGRTITPWATSTHGREINR